MNSSDVRKSPTSAMAVALASLVLMVTALMTSPVLAHNHETKSEYGSKSEATKMKERDKLEVPESVAHVEHIRRASAEHFTGGQPEQADFSEFAELGVQTVINMRSHDEMSEIPQAAWVTEAKQAYYHIPIAGTGDINRENVALFHQIMERESQNTLYMHCASSNRVGAMMALRAAWHKGASTEEALAIGEQYGMTTLRVHVESQLSQ